MAAIHVTDDPAATNTTDPAAVEPPLEAWDVTRVGAWLEAADDLGDTRATVAGNARRLGVDGATLARLDAEGGRELGVQSAVRRAKVRALVDAAGQALPQTRQNQRSQGPPRASVFSKMSARGEKVTFKHGGAAEHMRFWHAGAAHANAEGFKTKQHFLGFLGMYNVLALLSFTIGFNMLMSKEPLVEWIDAVIFLIVLLSTIMSAAGINATAIVFNITSACSDANSTALHKMPHMCRYMKQANDMCLLGNLPLLFAAILLAIKRGCLPFEDNGEPLPMFLLVGTIVIIVFCLWLGRHNNLATPMTCMVLFGGMMQDTALAPPGKDPKTWPYTATGKEIEAFFSNRALDKMKDDEMTMVKNTFDEYTDASLACRQRKRTARLTQRRKSVSLRRTNPLVPVFAAAAGNH